MTDSYIQESKGTRRREKNMAIGSSSLPLLLALICLHYVAHLEPSLAASDHMMGTRISACPDEHYTCAAPVTMTVPPQPGGCSQFIPDYAERPGSLVIEWNALWGMTGTHAVCRTVVLWSSPDCNPSSQSFSIDMPDSYYLQAKANRSDFSSRPSISGYFGPMPTHSSVEGVSCERFGAMVSLSGASMPPPPSYPYEQVATSDSTPASGTAPPSSSSSSKGGMSTSLILTIVSVITVFCFCVVLTLVICAILSARRNATWQEEAAAAAAAAADLWMSRQEPLVRGEEEGEDEGGEGDEHKVEMSDIGGEREGRRTEGRGDGEENV